MTLVTEINGLQNSLKRTFVTWAEGHPKWSLVYKKIPREVVAIAFDALAEMRSIKPGTFEVWWAENHNRYIRRVGVTQMALQRLHEVFYHFLSAFARGELNGKKSAPKEDERTEDEKPARKLRKAGR